MNVYKLNMNRFPNKLIIATCILFASIAHAKPQLVDAVVARVGSAIILKSDVDIFRKTAAAMSASDARDALIEMALVEQLSKKSGILVSQADIDRALGSMAEQRNISRSQLPTDKNYLDQLSKSILRMKLIQAKVMPGIVVTDAQVREAYQSEYAGHKNNSALKVEQLFIANEDYPDARKIAQDISKKGVSWPVGAIELAKKSEIAELGTFHAGELEPNYEKIVFSTPEGKISQPLEADDGFHLFFVKEKIDVLAPPLEKVKKALHNKILDGRVESAYKHYIAEARRSSDVEIIEK